MISSVIVKQKLLMSTLATNTSFCVSGPIFSLFGEYKKAYQNLRYMQRQIIGTFVLNDINPIGERKRTAKAPRHCQLRYLLSQQLQRVSDTNKNILKSPLCYVKERKLQHRLTWNFESYQTGEIRKYCSLCFIKPVHYK